MLQIHPIERIIFDISRYHRLIAIHTCPTALLFSSFVCLKVRKNRDL